MSGKAKKQTGRLQTSNYLHTVHPRLGNPEHKSDTLRVFKQKKPPRTVLAIQQNPNERPRDGIRRAQGGLRIETSEVGEVRGEEGDERRRVGRTNYRPAADGKRPRRGRTSLGDPKLRKTETEKEPGWSTSQWGKFPRTGASEERFS